MTILIALDAVVETLLDVIVEVTIEDPVDEL